MTTEPPRSSSSSARAPSKHARPIYVPQLTPNQSAMLSNAARVLWIGTGTKTGKTTALCLWIADGILRGEPTAWIGPWTARTKSAYDRIKEFLAPAIRAGTIRTNDSTMRLRSSGGGTFESFTGDNAQAIFGEGFKRVVIDEASRQTEASFTAALTTISATGGQVRLAFNLERGVRNWAIRNLLRVRHMTPEERLAQGENFMTFPTAPEGFVDRTLIDSMKSKMPLSMWEALYEAKIPESDVALFRNLDAVFTGAEREGPEPGHAYHAGVDLARKRDWSVITIMDSRTGAVVAFDRFHEVSWSLQYERCAEVYRRFDCRRALVDQTGLGDPCVEELRKRGMQIEGFIFSKSSKKDLIETLVVACDNVEITLPATPRFETYREEMDVFEYQLDGGEVKYSAPSGFSDDCVMSLALATHGFKKPFPGQGFLDYIQLQLRKQAIEECNGDVEAADRLLRERDEKWDRTYHPEKYSGGGGS